MILRMLFLSLNISVFPTDERLKEKRKLFVKSVSEDTLNNLLADISSQKVLNQGEVEIIKRNATTIAKARDLIDTVTHKGARASKLFIDCICKRNSTLAYEMGFSSGEILLFCLRAVSACSCISAPNICFLVHWSGTR